MHASGLTRSTATVIALAVAVCLAAGNPVAGVGEDVARAGEAIARTAEDAADRGHTLGSP